MESKRISHTARVIISLYNVAMFAAVWVLYYNDFAFQKFATAGCVVSVVIYMLLYHALCELYRSFKIASSSIAETVLSQVISFGIADLLLYAVCCLVANRYVNILPGVGTVVVQVAGSLLLVWAFKAFMIRHIAPKKTLLIYGEHIGLDEVTEYRDKLLAKYEHLFSVCDMVQASEDVYDMIGDRGSYGTVMLYEVTGEHKGRIIKHCIDTTQNIYFTPSIEDIVVANCEPKYLLDTPLMKYEYVYERTMTTVVKRIVDVAVSLVAIVLTSPIMLIIWLAIKIEDRGPAIFKQKRCTLNCKEFYIYKFRSMIVDADKGGFRPCTAGDDRITKVGKVIRKIRMDELPQLFNILFGDMSLVGPRPERIEHVQAYTADLPEFALRTRVKAGLTGYAQIYGKYNTTAYDKLRLDLMYIENQSLILDFKLILLTLKIIFVPESSEGFEEKKSKAIAENKNARVNVQEEMAATRE
ncbi:MAG: sugar transferase [Lachnospira sp.]|nr:sugar transferase [Lachnospira sp.]